MQIKRHINEKSYMVSSNIEGEIKSELALMGINPFDMLYDDDFCRAHSQYKCGRITLERLLEIAALITDNENDDMNGY